MSSKIFVPAYWPLFNTGELRRFDYVGDGMPPFASVFSYDVGSKSMLYNNYDSKNEWLNRWYYRYETGFGISEWRDDYPGNKKVVLKPPIGWGEFQEVGSVYQDKPKFDFFRCWPPATGYGDQIVMYEKRLPEFTACDVIYTDVIQFSYLQAWGGKPATGARYWMALGVGPVATQFIAQDEKDPSKVIETGRWDAVVTRVNV